MDGLHSTWNNDFTVTFLVYSLLTRLGTHYRGILRRLYFIAYHRYFQIIILFYPARNQFKYIPRVTILFGQPRKQHYG